MIIRNAQLVNIWNSGTHIHIETVVDLYLVVRAHHPTTNMSNNLSLWNTRENTCTVQSCKYIPWLLRLYPSTIFIFLVDFLLLLVMILQIHYTHSFPQASSSRVMCAAILMLRIYQIWYNNNGIKSKNINLKEQRLLPPIIYYVDWDGCLSLLPLHVLLLIVHEISIWYDTILMASWAGHLYVVYVCLERQKK